MNNIITINIIRFIALVLLQVLVLRQFYFGPVFGAYFRTLMYPLFLMMLPYRLRSEFLMLIAFGTGLTVDIAYDTFGLHASACVGLAAIRPLVLDWLQPKGGYNINKGLTPEGYGWPWFAQYALICLLIFSFWLSLLEVFQLWKIGEVILRTVFSIPISLFFIFIGVMTLRPKS